MVRTRSGLGNDNGNQHTEPCVIERTLDVMPVVEPNMMAAVQAMIRTIPIERTIQLFQRDKREVIALVNEPRDKR